MFLSIQNLIVLKIFAKFFRKAAVSYKPTTRNFNEKDSITVVSLKIREIFEGKVFQKEVACMKAVTKKFANFIKSKLFQNIL